MRTIITSQLVEKCISEHPAFYFPVDEWGVVKAHAEWDYDESGRVVPDTERFVPEDRSKWKPEFDGTSMADQWDSEKGEFRPGTPMADMGVTMFMGYEMDVRDGTGEVVGVALFNELIQPSQQSTP